MSLLSGVGEESLRWRVKLYGALFFATFALRFDPAPFVDSFYERRIYQQSLETFERRAVGARYEECREQLARCLGKGVVWPVVHAVEGDARYEGDPGKPVLFSNLKQVPTNTDERTPFMIVGVVRAVHPRGIELLYVGSPSARFGGTTWVKTFGYEKAAERAL